MPRGGKRVGSGNKSKWKSGKTKTIRVPIALADHLLELARVLDDGESLEIVNSTMVNNIIDSDTESKVIDLSGVSLASVSGQMGIKLTDLIRKGYEIHPKRLNDIVLAALEEK